MPSVLSPPFLQGSNESRNPLRFLRTVALGCRSPPDTPTPSESIRILLTPQPTSPTTGTDPIERELQDNVPIRLGRQVREPTTTPHKQATTAAGVLLPSSPSSRQTDYIYFKSKVVSRHHAEFWIGRDGQVYLKDTASSSGTFLNRLRLSPSGKESRPYPVKSGDVIQMGVDYQGRSEEVYKAPIFRLSIIHPPTHCATLKKNHLTTRFRKTLHTLLTLANPYSTTSDPSPTAQLQDCCICLSGIGPYQALFLAPCSHCYHFKCVKGMLSEGDMFLCPLCRQVANLDASVSMESLCDVAGSDDESVAEESELGDEQEQDWGSNIAVAHEETLELPASLSPSPETDPDVYATFRGDMSRYLELAGDDGKLSRGLTLMASSRESES
ncbi:uncharacterized protein SPPG_05247 [Spizellomyces punctatus DAOM BR117]|uniref:FHA domain-containing protein n=1 Tax=Spizellomyces punctatus (strain DAOM BR117) TaxID=645134 RepID=A0A0L0HEI9_SPIPD|nr:uncharacterized protein SPPG_05247 [Spizellomyces punctatus DAOM BR117]KNC99875.1 hypothetical protein SPPG_05247 [Spizellomyces punctatus DAOM BR117]|eukprot:XP_016607915.1 hypothetical protein SPPG_05247 [Spizellomyces punctatus DAOM BR117]